MSSNAKRAKVMHETHCSVDVAARIRVLIALRICIDPVHRAPAKIKPIEVKAAANTQASKQASKQARQQATFDPWGENDGLASGRRRKHQHKLINFLLVLEEEFVDQFWKVWPESDGVRYRVLDSRRVDVQF